jgi:hypothetical protein
MTVRINTVRFIVAALAYTVFAYLLHLIGALLTLQFYLDPAYFPVWSRLLMPTAGPPPLAFSVYSLILGFAAALLFVFIFLQVRPLFKGTSRARRGATYGFGVFLVGGLPGFFMLWLLINLPFLLLVDYAIEGLIANIVGGVFAAYITQE